MGLREEVQNWRGCCATGGLVRFLAFASAASYFLRTILIEFTASGLIVDESRARVRSPGFKV